MFQKIKIYLSVIVFSACICRAEIPVVTGDILSDAEGRHVNCHGGCIIRGGDGTYYWYGEHRGMNAPQEGVACYSSADLVNWNNRGIVMQVSDIPGSVVERGSTIERPKVIYNAVTGKYVMWFHHELKGRGYEAAQAAVSVADNPLGPFVPIRSARVNPRVLPVGMDASGKDVQFDYNLEWWTPEWYAQVKDGMFVHRDVAGGQMSRDMTLYVDDDGKAYHIYSSEENLTLQIAELDSAYTSHTGRYIRIFPGGHNEAPAIFKHEGRYWMITSGCTGWAPNAARLMWADSIMGEWHLLPNPCHGPGADITFGGQGTYVLCDGDDITFMADIWNPKCLPDSRHLWLPITFGDYGVPVIENPGVGHNPVLPGFHADPEIMYSEQTGRYYIYSTTDGVPGWGGHYFQVYSSADLMDWKDEGIMLDLKGEQVAWASGNAWAPAIIECREDDGYKYYFYYSGHSIAADKKQIGVAVANHPTGPFIDHGAPVITDSPVGRGQQIDVDVFKDPVSGKCYIYWGNGYMSGAELNDDMVSLNENTVTVMTPQGGTLDTYAYREAPYVFYRNGIYYFMWSVDDTGSPNYHVAYGTSDSPLGPIEVADPCNILMQNQAKQIYGTAHNSVINIPGTDEWYIVYHRIHKDYIASERKPGIHRQVCIDRLEFNEDGSIIPVEPTN